MQDIKLDFNAEALSSFFARRLSTYETAPQVYQYGTVESAADGIVHVVGLPSRRYGELLSFESGIFGMTLDLEENGVGAVLLSDADQVYVGGQVRGTEHVVEVPVGDALLGRVVDPLGRPLDGGALSTSGYQPVERPAPSIIDRQPVNTPLMTGLLCIDSMIPIGRGQRELIIGDRQTGKTTIALDTILNQKNSGVLCVYCAIGQKASSVAQLVNTLQLNGALDYTTVVVSTASDSAAMQYIAPYAACTIAEDFMRRGKDVLVVYDDLSKHAVAYRTMSLLLQRPPGREAYPGDVFYLHSRLLERAAHLSDAHGGGSMTALPIVETMGGDISAYIPTNVISITDGQIFLETELFHAGVRPAVNVGLSVSRVGRAAQYKAMRRVSGTLRIDLAQYRELQVFSQFGSDVDASTRNLLERGAQLTETLKQHNGAPYPLSQQAALLLAFTQGAMKGLSIKNVQTFNEGMMELLARECEPQMRRIDETGDMDDDVMNILARVIRNYAVTRWGVG